MGSLKIQNESGIASQLGMARFGQFGTQEPHCASQSSACSMLCHVRRAYAAIGRTTLASVCKPDEMAKKAASSKKKDSGKSEEEAAAKKAAAEKAAAAKAAAEKAAAEKAAAEKAAAEKAAA